MQLLNIALSTYRSLLWAFLAMAVLFGLMFGTDVNLDLLFGWLGAFYILCAFHAHARERWPNSFVFRKPTVWLYGLLAASAMSVAGLVYGLVYLHT